MKNLILVLILFASVATVWAHDDEHDEDEVEAVDVNDIIVPERPTYHEHVRPIIEAACVACHSDGQIAAYAPFSDPQDVVLAAQDIKFHVVNGIMPPWMPSRENLPLKNDRSLSDEEIATIVAWVDDGAGLGDPEKYVPAATEAFVFAEIRPTWSCSWASHIARLKRCSMITAVSHSSWTLMRHSFLLDMNSYRMS